MCKCLRYRILQIEIIVLGDWQRSLPLHVLDKISHRIPRSPSDERVVQLRVATLGSFSVGQLAVFTRELPQVCEWHRFQRRPQLSLEVVERQLLTPDQSIP